MRADKGIKTRLDYGSLIRMEGLEDHQSGYDYVSTPYDLSTLVLWQEVNDRMGREPGFRE